MIKESLDPEQYKAGQRQQWDAVAIGWKKWWQTMEHGARHVSNRLIDMAEIRSGHKVLDIATGIGEPAATAARRVGPAGRVVATDQSPKMLAIARERAAELGLQNMDFMEMDAEALNFPEDSFDAILCRWGLMFLPDLKTTLMRIRQMMVPNGRFASSVWDVPAQVPFASIAFNIAREMFKLPSPPAGTPSLFGLSEGVLERSLAHAGFVNIHSEMLVTTFEFQTVEEFTQYLQDIAAPIIALLTNQPPRQQTEFWQALSAAVQQYTTADGRLHMPGRTICVVGTK